MHTKKHRVEKGITRSVRLRATLLCVAALTISFATTKAQDKESGKAVSMQAMGYAESPPVYALPPYKGGSKSHLREEEEEKNPENREIIRHVDPTVKPSADAALSSAAAKKLPHGAQPRVLPTPSVSFEGISEPDTVPLGQGFLPPDTNGEVGPNHFVQTVNVAFRIWDKNGNPLTNVASLADLFSALGGPCATTTDGDPIVLYDQLADRWIISQFCVSVANPNNHQLIAVSKTGDPTGSYYLYDFMMPNNKFNDYPHFGVWPDGYYMTDNQFNQAGDTFLQDGVFAFDRAKMLAGDPTASYVYFDTAVLFPPSTGITGPDGINGMLAADLDGFTPPPAGAPCPFAYFEAGEFGDPADQLRIFDFHADFTTPANSTFTERTGSPLAVAAFDPVTVPDSRNVIPQPSVTSSRYVDAINDRLMFRLAYRNFGNTETLVLNHTVNAAVNPSYRAAVRFYELQRATPSGAFSIVEQQTFDGSGDTNHRWMGSVAMNFLGDIALGYSVSSTSVFPSIRYAAKLNTDPTGSGLTQGEQSIIVGAGSQTSTSGRWGDYSDMTVDPSDDCSFWYTQEYYSTTSSAGWHTRVSKITVGTQATSPRGTISGTITDCQTGNPIANALVQIAGGYSRPTAANGTYSATVAPGTYSATVTAINYGPVTANGLVVSDGGNATFNACLSGFVSIAAVPPAVVIAENFSPANSAADPGEYVTVNLPLHNIGSINTTNLVGTLQASGGVMNPSGPQNYGVVTTNGSTVTRSFSFIASGNCGDFMTLTLALQDGAANLGTITYQLRLGGLTNGPLFSENFDSVTAPALPANWTTSATGSESAWVTSTSNTNSAPNDCFVPDVSNVGNTELVTPTIPVPSGGGQLSFRNLFNMEASATPTVGYDGMVLEISINGGAFADITSGGNAFTAGGYTRTISTSFSNPLAGRSAWSGLSGGTTSAPTYITSTINFPAAAAGQNIKLKWRVGTDNSAVASGAAGIRIDDVTITGSFPSCVSNQAPSIINGPPPSPVIVGTPYSFTFVASGNPAPVFSYTGVLPSGLGLSAAGLLSGTVSDGGTGSFPNITVTASNGVLPDATQNFSLATATRVTNYIASFGLSGSDAVLNYDYDRDGFSNLMEYALGLNPTVASLAGAPVVTLKDYSGTSYLSITFHRSSLATDLTYIVQASSDLVSWSDLAMSSGGGVTSGLGFVSETGSAPSFTVEVRDTVAENPFTSPRRFMRLKITSP